MKDVLREKFVRREECDICFFSHLQEALLILVTADTHFIPRIIRRRGSEEIETSEEAERERRKKSDSRGREKKSGPFIVSYGVIKCCM